MKFILIHCLLLLSCNASILSENIRESDSLSIDFADQNQVVIKQIETTDKTAINKLIDYIGNKTFQKNKCSLGGRISFYRSGVVVEQVEFNSSGGCRYFTFKKNGELISTKMNDEAASFLESLKDGRTYY